MKKVIFEHEYHGFESVYDLPRDIDEMWEPRLNPKFKDVLESIPAEFQGTIKVTVTYDDTES